MYTDGWFFEDDINLSVAFKIKEKIYSSKSKYQKIDVIDSYAMGKVLLLDNMVMVTEKDEFYYHENITHPVLSIHHNPKNIMVIGGGDGGTVREALKYNTIEKIELVEIDKEVIDVSKKFFPEIACEMDNPKVKIILNDATEHIKNVKENFFDIIICDCTDPNPDTIASGLISKDFYKKISTVLHTDGIFISQNGCPILQEKLFETAINNMRSIFRHVDLITSISPSYPGGFMFVFLIGSNRPLDKKIKNKPAGKTKFWNENLHEKLFIKPEWLEKKYFTVQVTSK